jgi:hypothetical protein
VILVGAGLCSHSLVTLLGDAQFDTLALWQGDVCLRGLSDYEDVGQTGGEHMTVGILNVDDLERSWMFLAVDDCSDTTQISSSGDHDQVACERKEVNNAVGGKSKKILPDSKRMWSVIFPVAMST